MSKDLFADLDHRFAERLKRLQAAALAAKLPLKLIITIRSIVEQNGLYAKGRTAPGPKVTNAKGGYSWHNFGLAGDWWGPTMTPAQWQKFGHLARVEGLTWGGDWPTLRDYGHVEYRPPGTSLAQLRRNAGLRA